MHPESTGSLPAPAAQAGRCAHCGAPLIRVVTSYQHNLVGDVCSVGWIAAYAPDALPCGARRAATDTRYALTELGQRALLEAFVFGPGPSVAEAMSLPTRAVAA